MKPLPEWTVVALRSLGWLADRPGSWQSVLESYQRFHGLDITAELDDDTREHLTQPRFCSHPDVMPLALAQTKRSASATWQWVGPALPGVPDADVRKTIQGAFDAWSAVGACTARETNGPASIVIQTGRIDGPLGVLGQTELPGPVTQHMLLDNAERWVIHIGPLSPTDPLLDLFRVLCHELGHFWGIGHIGTGNLMAPLYNPAIWLPQKGDVAEIVSRYGPAKTPPAPPAPPSPPVPGPSITLPATIRLNADRTWETVS